ncbi:hypothetical protein FF38_09146 [Lucilia cuprina]|uniref:Uncharacterized protein n=1 Tax=Lucilia cuprina TaxID=7375 RepID=A0A0L0CR45_LUCCU|nr:hypothetical protein FF38_09146 [Lucilia cuprina]
MGLPQKPLDEISAKFLANEFQNLINEANTDKADYDVRNMKREIENSLINKTDRKFRSLDPLNTDTQQLESMSITKFDCNNFKMENISTKLEK